MNDCCNCTGRLGDPLGDMPGPIHERGSRGCRYGLTWGERVTVVGLAVAGRTLEAMAWVARKWKEVRRG
jgi:hypothetical protein